MTKGPVIINANRRYEWPQDARDTLVSMWEDGFSATLIQRALADAGYDFTRNAVLGKVHRLRLPCHTRPDGEHRAVIKNKPKVPRKVNIPRPVMEPKRPATPPPPPKPEPWAGPPINILDDRLTMFMCRAIVSGRGPETMFCGGPVPPGSPYSFCGWCRQTMTRLHNPGRARSEEAKAKTRRTMMMKRREAIAA